MRQGRIGARSPSTGSGRRGVVSLSLALIAALALLAGCSLPTLPTSLQPPPPGDAAQIAIGDALPALDPNKEGSEAWQRTNGPYAWSYKVAVGSGQDQSRMLMYYWLPGQNFIGTRSDAELLAKIKTISGQYQQLDPAHPVVNAIDIVDPVVNPVAGADGKWRTRLDEGLIQRYIDLATKNNMYFYFDTQVGHSTQQEEVTYLMKWLHQPNVSVALDPEWEMAPGAIPGVNVGRTYASSINWVIDQISTMVLTEHLPPKTLIVHEFRPEVAPDWQNIVLKPGVTLVICVDGQGTPQAKIDKYDFLTYKYKATRTYGFKVFLNIPCSQYKYCEEPVMTPAQVLALDPKPVMIQYQ